MEPDSKDIGIITDQVLETTCSKCGCKIDVSGLEPFVGVECPDCGSIQNVPAKLGQFLLLNLIGKGGMGGVYYAEDTSLGRHVAIKVMLQSLGDNQEFVETFKREAQAVAKLNHPNIVQIYAFGKEKGQPYIVMELVNGLRFDKMMEGGKQIDQALVMKIAKDIAEALKAADEIGLIHGDIKPENILLDEKGQAKLVDFGLATFAHQSSAEGIWGTPYYIAPEKIRRQPVDARSDIYSLGATLYHALTGKPPFEGKTPIDVVKARLEKDPANISILRPKIDRHVESIVMRMLQRQPVRRFPNYSSLIGDLRKAIETLGPVKTGTFAAPKPKQSMIIQKKKTSQINVGQEEKPEHTGRKASIKIPATPRPNTGPETPSIPGDSYSKRLLQSVSQPKKEKRSIKIPTWMYFLAAAGLIAWGITAAVLKSKHNKEQARAEKIESLSLAKERAVAEQTFSSIQLTTTNISKMARSSEGCIDKVINAVLVVTGEQLAKPSLKPKAEEPGVTAAQVEATATSNETKNVTAILPKSKPDKTANEKKEDAGPPGEATKEQLDHTLQQKQPKTEPAAPKMAGAPKPGIVLEKIENEHEIRGLARKIFENAIKITEKTTKAMGIEENASALKDKALKAPLSYNAAAENKQLSGELESLQALETETRALLSDCEKTTQQAETIKTEFEEAAKIKKKMEEDAIKKQAEEEAEKRKAEELKVLIENEKKLAETTRNNCLPMLKLYDFNGARDLANTQAATFQTSEGKAAIKILVDRYTYLQKLKLFLIERLNAETFKWGWLTPSQDIVGADMIGVKIRKGTISWPEISGGQLLRIIDFCLASKGTPYKIKAENSLATAILCYELGGIDSARKYASQSVDLSASMKDEAARLLPLGE